MQRDETGSQHSSASSGGDSGGGKRRADGRKSSKPKKLRLNSAPAVAAPAPAETETSPPLPQLAQVTHYLVRNTILPIGDISALEHNFLKSAYTER